MLSKLDPSAEHIMTASFEVNSEFHRFNNSKEYGVVWGWDPSLKKFFIYPSIPPKK